MPNTGCYLDVVPNRKLVWTGALLPGYRPANLSADVPFVFTAVIELEPHGTGTKYTANRASLSDQEAPSPLPASRCSRSF